MDRDQFRRLIDDRVRTIAGVGLDDLPDVSLDDWLDDADGIADEHAELAALEAALEILEDDGLDEDVVDEARRLFGGYVEDEEGDE
jgi:hypothetical protein